MSYLAAASSGLSQSSFEPEPSDRICCCCQAPCTEVCFNDAVERVGGKISIDTERCAGCGACAGACSYGKIEVVNGVAQVDDD
jgi:Fe-S-cluster-containing hydrogenase component 2